VRRSADVLLKHLRRWRDAGRPVAGGIAHAFNGSDQQAQAFLGMGFKLGFGGAMTFDRALQIRRLAAKLPDDAIVLETDAPDIPPHWLYQTAEARAAAMSLPSCHALPKRWRHCAAGAWTTPVLKPRAMPWLPCLV
jgi:TatD DNase family protein